MQPVSSFHHRHPRKLHKVFFVYLQIFTENLGKLMCKLRTHADINYRPCSFIGGASESKGYFKLILTAVYYCGVRIDFRNWRTDCCIVPCSSIFIFFTHSVYHLDCYFRLLLLAYILSTFYGICTLRYTTRHTSIAKPIRHNICGTRIYKQKLRQRYIV